MAEPFFPKERLIILGGGHVALPVAEFGARVGFLVTVVDDRLSFANPGRFPMAEKGVCDDLDMQLKNSRFRRVTISVSSRADTATMRTACG